MAGLIPQSFIDELLSRVDIVEVVNRRVPLKRAGANHIACCPFHQEKTPSFNVHSERQFYHCFGCGEGGNAIGFIMNYEQQNFPAAVETLAQEVGLEVPREETKADQRRQRENNAVLDSLENASRFYQDHLHKHPTGSRAARYLEQRGLSGEIIREFSLGFAPPGWENLLGTLGTDEEKVNSLLRAGLIIERDAKNQPARATDSQASRGYYDRFRNRIMFPIRNERGRIVAFGGRVLGGDDQPKYMNSPETPVFRKGSELYGLYELKQSREKFERLLLVEGYMDVIALVQMGVRNTVATLGTATSDRHLQRLFRQVSEIVFCFDGDTAGRTAAWRALEITLPLMEDGRQVRFLFLPEGTDPDSFVRKEGRDRLQEAIAAAQPLEHFFFAKLSSGLDLESIEGRARLSNLAKPLMRKLPKGLYLQLMLDRLSGIVGVNSQSLGQLMAEQSASPASEPVLPPAPPPGRWGPPAERPIARSARHVRPRQLRAIELLLCNPKAALEFELDLEPLKSEPDQLTQKLVKMIEMIRGNPQMDTNALKGHCYGAGLGAVLAPYSVVEKITPTHGLEKELCQILDNMLSDAMQKQEKQLLSKKIRDLGRKLAVPAVPDEG